MLFVDISHCPGLCLLSFSILIRLSNMIFNQLEESRDIAGVNVTISVPDGLWRSHSGRLRRVRKEACQIGFHRIGASEDKSSAPS